MRCCESLALAHSGTVRLVQGNRDPDSLTWRERAAIRKGAVFLIVQKGGLFVEGGLKEPLGKKKREESSPFVRRSAGPGDEDRWKEEGGERLGRTLPSILASVFTDSTKEEGGRTRRKPELLREKKRWGQARRGQKPSTPFQKDR